MEEPAPPPRPPAAGRNNSPTSPPSSSRAQCSPPSAPADSGPPSPSRTPPPPRQRGPAPPPRPPTCPSPRWRWWTSTSCCRSSRGGPRAARGSSRPSPRCPQSSSHPTSPRGPATEPPAAASSSRNCCYNIYTFIGTLFVCVVTNNLEVVSFIETCKVINIHSAPGAGGCEGQEECLWLCAKVTLASHFSLSHISAGQMSRFLLSRQSPKGP